MPMYRAKNIGWLAFEGLKNQNCPYPWEVIAMQEEGDSLFNEMDHDEIREAMKGLVENGCVSWRVIGLKKHVPLSLKWREIAILASKSSKTFVLQAADCYSHPKRLKMSHEKIMDGFDWFHQEKGLFIDLMTGEQAMYHHEPRFKTALNMAVRTDLVRELPSIDVRSGVDGWIFRSCSRIKNERLKVFMDTSDAWKGGIDTHGFNNISKARGKRIKIGIGVFKKKQMDINEMLPENVANRINDIIRQNRDGGTNQGH